MGGAVELSGRRFCMALFGDIACYARLTDVGNASVLVAALIGDLRLYGSAIHMVE